jgi:hypothetical protein
VSNQAGLRQAADGTWHYPFVEKDGRWSTRTDIVWRTTPGPAKSTPMERAVAMVNAAEAAFPAFEYENVRVVPQGPVVRQDELVQVVVRAWDISGRGQPVEMDVDDGRFLFHNPPLTHNGVYDPLGALRRILVDAIRRIN